MFDEDNSNFVITPAIATKLLISSIVAGILATMVGIGGGLVVLPILLNIGVPSLQTAATVGFIVLYSSALSLTQTVFQRKFKLPQLIVFAVIPFFGSIIVSRIVHKIVEKY